MIKINELKVGDKVSVRYSDSSQGVYVVSKANKVRVCVRRVSDGYEREFSVKRGVEFGSVRYHSAFIESIGDMERREAMRKFQNELRRQWENIESAAKAHSVVEVEAALAVVKKMLEI